MPTPRYLALFRREPGTPDTMPLFRVVVAEPVTVREEVVLEKESYAIASQLCDCLNYKFGHRGALAVFGMAVVGEVAEVADNIVQRLRERDAGKES